MRRNATATQEQSQSQGNAGMQTSAGTNLKGDDRATTGLEVAVRLRETAPSQSTQLP